MYGTGKIQPDNTPERKKKRKAKDNNWVLTQTKRQHAELKHNKTTQPQPQPINDR